MKLGRWAAVAILSVSGPAQAQDPARLEEVRVTAQRQAEYVQRAAVAVSVVTPGELRDAGVAKPQELTDLVPSLQVAASAAPISVYYLRGVGNFTGNVLTDSAVAFNVDGVFIGRPHSTAGFFYDLERIEVLKGPQGTLYGRNATGGAINVLPRRPELGAWSRQASMEIGNEEQRRFDGTLNIPLGSRAAMRAAAFHAEHGGFMSDGLDEQDDTAGRISFLAQPRDDFSIRVAADYFDQGGRGTGTTALALGPANRYGISSAEVGAFLETQRNGIAGRNFNRIPPTQRLDNWFRGLHAEVDWTTASGTFTLLPAYRESHLDTVGTALGPTVTTIEDDRQTSVEARFASNRSGRFSYIAGAYWFDEANNIPLFVPNTQYSMSVQKYQTGIQSSAAFGRLTYAWSDSVRATVGARYTDEEKFFRGTFDGALRLCPPVPVASCPNAARFPVTQISPPTPGPAADGTVTAPFAIVSNDKLTFAKWTWRAAVDWDVAENRFLYASFETGFKSGGFFFSNDSRVFQPEQLDAVTLGSRNRLLDGRLQLDVEAFHWQYDDQQISTVARDSRGATNLITRNVGKATIRGIELDTRWLLNDATRIRLNAQYLDAVYDEFRYDVPGPAPPLTGCAVTPGGAVFRVDCSDKRAPYAPEWTINLTAERTFDLASRGRVMVATRLRYQTEVLTGLDFTPLEYQGSYTTLGASVTWTSRDKRLEIAAFGNNLTDEAVVANSFQHPFGSFVVGTLRAPRLFGLRLGVNY